MKTQDGMFEYHTSVVWKGGEQADLLSPAKPTLAIEPPPEFGGHDNVWSPEDLLLGAVESCLLLTVLFFVDKMKIRMRGYRSKAVARMARTPQGLRFQGVDVEIEGDLESEEDAPKFRNAVAQAESRCPVGAALNCPVRAVAIVSAR